VDQIEGGYYIKARKIQESEIAYVSPHIREIWDWLLKEANHKDCKYAGIEIKRGQCIRSYKDIQEGLSWKIGYRKMKYSKNHCETAMRWLTKHTMVHTMKLTHGMLVTILNYNKYQDPKNYVKYNETYKEHTRNIQAVDTKQECNNVNNEKQVKSDGHFLQFWKAYPKKVGKKAAEKSYKNISQSKEQLNIILNAIEKQKRSIQWEKEDGKYIPNPTTWLNQGRWDDELKPKPEPTQAILEGRPF